DEHGLAQPGHALQHRVPTGQQAHEYSPHDVVLSDDDLSNLLLDRPGALTELNNLRIDDAHGAGGPLPKYSRTTGRSSAGTELRSARAVCTTPPVAGASETGTGSDTTWSVCGWSASVCASRAGPA